MVCTNSVSSTTQHQNSRFDSVQANCEKGTLPNCELTKSHLSVNLWRWWQGQKLEICMGFSDRWKIDIDTDFESTKKLKWQGLQVENQTISHCEVNDVVCWKKLRKMAVCQMKCFCVISQRGWNLNVWTLSVLWWLLLWRLWSNVFCLPEHEPTNQMSLWHWLGMLFSCDGLLFCAQCFSTAPFPTWKLNCCTNGNAMCHVFIWWNAHTFCCVPANQHHFLSDFLSESFHVAALLLWQCLFTFNRLNERSFVWMFLPVQSSQSFPTFHKVMHSIFGSSTQWCHLIDPHRICQFLVLFCLDLVSFQAQVSQKHNRHCLLHCFQILSWHCWSFFLLLLFRCLDGLTVSWLWIVTQTNRQSNRRVNSKREHSLFPWSKRFGITRNHIFSRCRCGLLPDVGGIVVWGVMMMSKFAKPKRFHKKNEGTWRTSSHKPINPKAGRSVIANIIIYSYLSIPSSPCSLCRPCRHDACFGFVLPLPPRPSAIWTSTSTFPWVFWKNMAFRFPSAMLRTTQTKLLISFDTFSTSVGSDATRMLWRPSCEMSTPLKLAGLGCGWHLSFGTISQHSSRCDPPLLFLCKSKLATEGCRH